MSRLLNDLLQLSRSTRGDLQREHIDLSDIAITVARRLQYEDPSRRVVFDIEPGLRAFGDPRLLRLVIGNLLGNAWKYTRHVARRQSPASWSVMAAGCEPRVTRGAVPASDSRCRAPASPPLPPPESAGVAPALKQTYDRAPFAAARAYGQTADIENNHY